MVKSGGNHIAEQKRLTIPVEIIGIVRGVKDKDIMPPNAKLNGPAKSGQQQLRNFTKSLVPNHESRNGRSFIINAGTLGLV